MLQENKSKYFESNLIVGGKKEDRMRYASEMAKDLLGDKVELEKLTGIDFFVVEKYEDKSGIVIEQIRELQNKLSKKPYVAKKKVTVLFEVGSASLQTQNCLLKTLEEPPGNTILILTAQDTESVIPTIKSRCRVITLKNSEVQYGAQNQEKWKTIFEEIISAGKGERLSWTNKNKEIFEDREEIIGMLDYFIERFRQHLLINLDEPPLVQAIEELLYFKKSISTVSVNVRIAVENLFLSLPIISDNDTNNVLE